MKSWRLALVVALCAACPAEAKAQGAVLNGVKNAAKTATGIPKTLRQAVPKPSTVRPLSLGGPRSAAVATKDDGALALAKGSAPVPALEAGASGSAIAGAAGEAPEFSLREGAKEYVQGVAVDKVEEVFDPEEKADDQAKVQLSPSQAKFLEDFQRSKAEPPANDDWVYPLGLVVVVAGIWLWLRRA